MHLFGGHMKGDGREHQPRKRHRGAQYRGQADSDPYDDSHN
jgi:hypothetical protein